jgi:hypothetical protein
MFNAWILDLSYNSRPTIHIWIVGHELYFNSTIHAVDKKKNKNKKKKKGKGSSLGTTVV